MSMSLSMFLLRVHVRILAAFPSPCCITLSMLRRRGYAAWASTRSIDIDLQHGHELDLQHILDHGHAAWTWTRHAASTCPCMDMDIQHVQVHSAYPSPHCVSMSMRHAMSILLHVHVHSACPCPRYMSMSMLFVNVNAVFVRGKLCCSPSQLPLCYNSFALLELSL